MVFGRRKKIAASILAIIFMGLTISSYLSEQQYPNLEVSGDANFFHPGLTDNSYFTHNFSMLGSNSTYSFSFFWVVTTGPGSPNGTLSIGTAAAGEMTKISQNTVFPFNQFQLKLDKVELVVNNTKVDFNGMKITDYSNDTAWFSNDFHTSYFQYTYPNSTDYNSSQLYPYSINLSYEVTPIVESGPYYIVGQSTWISYSFIALLNAQPA